MAENRKDPYYEEEPDWMEYLDRTRGEALNRERGVFEKKDKSSINTAASVFEAGTIFHVNKAGGKEK